jgi:serine/threonine-protein kinase
MPETIGRYQVQSSIGFGAMGAVYKAFDPLIKRTLAIKTLRLDIPRNSPQYRSFIDRFYHEARISGTLSHPNIVTLFDIGEEDGVPYLAMEFVEGETLASILENGTRFKPEKVISLVSQIASAVDYAHSKGVIHRDIKPSNLILSDGERIKITDFGIAKVGDAEMTQSGTVLGTPAYMSPEQAMGEKLDGRSDIFSLGVCAFEMLSGEQPFAGPNVTAILYRLVHVEPIEPANLETHGLVPQKWREVFGKVLAKQPDERYQTANEFVQDLEYCLGSWFGSAMVDTVVDEHKADAGAAAALAEPSRAQAGSAVGPAPGVASRAPVASPPAPAAAPPKPIVATGPRRVTEERQPALSRADAVSPSAPAAGLSVPLLSDDDLPETVLIGPVAKPPDPAQPARPEAAQTPHVEETVLIKPAPSQPSSPRPSRESAEPGPTVLVPAAGFRGKPAASSARAVAVPAASLPAAASPARGPASPAPASASRAPTPAPANASPTPAAASAVPESTVLLPAREPPPPRRLAARQAPAAAVRSEPRAGATRQASSAPMAVSVRRLEPRPAPASDPAATTPFRSGTAAETLTAPATTGTRRLVMAAAGLLVALLAAAVGGLVLVRRLGEQASAQSSPTDLPAVSTTAAPSTAAAAPSSQAGGVPAFTGSMRVESQPGGASVIVDGQPRGSTPLDLAELPLGAHEVRIELRGFESAVQKVMLTAEAPRSELSLALPPSAAPMGMAEVHSTPAGARVRIDGVPVGLTPLRQHGLKPGGHAVEVVKDGFEPWSGRLDVQREGIARTFAQLRPLPRAIPTPEPADLARVYLPNEVDTAPRRIQGGSAPYPERAPRLRPGKDLTVGGTFVVTEAGEVTDLKITESAGRLIDEAVLAAVRTWKYAPGSKRGAKVKVRLSFKQTYRAG